jgi:hypothetical protein
MLARACVLVALALCLGAASAQWSNSVGKRYVNFAFATYCPTVRPARLRARSRAATGESNACASC